MLEYCVFIISHRRANTIYTIDTLSLCGYTGRTIIVVDNTDPTIGEYMKQYGTENVIVFDKYAIAQKTDNYDNFENYRSTTHARNACFEIAEKIGYENFLVLDDDYTDFQYRYIKGNKLKVAKVSNLDEVFSAVFTYLNNTPIKALALAQGGDFIGGAGSKFAKSYGTKRKAMNSFFCSTKKPIKFVSRLNEDVNTYLTNGQRGDIYLTISHVMLQQKETQRTSGGMTEAYLDFGTYVKSAYSMICAPSCVTIAEMGNINMRIHHNIETNNAYPKIIREDAWSGSNAK